MLHFRSAYWEYLEFITRLNVHLANLGNDALWLKRFSIGTVDGLASRFELCPISDDDTDEALVRLISVMDANRRPDRLGHGSGNGTQQSPEYIEDSGSAMATTGQWKQTNIRQLARKIMSFILSYTDEQLRKVLAGTDEPVDALQILKQVFRRQKRREVKELFAKTVDQVSALRIQGSKPAFAAFVQRNLKSFRQLDVSLLDCCTSLLGVQKIEDYEWLDESEALESFQSMFVPEFNEVAEDSTGRTHEIMDVSMDAINLEREREREAAYSEDSFVSHVSNVVADAAPAPVPAPATEVVRPVQHTVSTSSAAAPSARAAPASSVPLMNLTIASSPAPSSTNLSIASTPDPSFAIHNQSQHRPNSHDSTETQGQSGLVSNEYTRPSPPTGAAAANPTARAPAYNRPPTQPTPPSNTPAVTSAAPSAPPPVTDPRVRPKSSSAQVPAVPAAETNFSITSSRTQSPATPPAWYAAGAETSRINEVASETRQLPIKPASTNSTPHWTPEQHADNSRLQKELDSVRLQALRPKQAATSTSSVSVASVPARPIPNPPGTKDLISKVKRLKTSLKVLYDQLRSNGEDARLRSQHTAFSEEVRITEAHLRRVCTTGPYATKAARKPPVAAAAAACPKPVAIASKPLATYAAAPVTTAPKPPASTASSSSPQLTALAGKSAPPAAKPAPLPAHHLAEQPTPASAATATDGSSANGLGVSIASQRQPDLFPSVGTSTEYSIAGSRTDTRPDNSLVRPRPDDEGDRSPKRHQPLPNNDLISRFRTSGNDDEDRTPGHEHDLVWGNRAPPAPSSTASNTRSRSTTPTTTPDLLASRFQPRPSLGSFRREPRSDRDHYRSTEVNNGADRGGELAQRIG